MLCRTVLALALAVVKRGADMRGFAVLPRAVNVLTAELEAASAASKARRSIRIEESADTDAGRLRGRGAGRASRRDPGRAAEGCAEEQSEKVITFHHRTPGSRYSSETLHQTAE